MSISEMISSSPTAAVISNPRLPDNPIIACNDAFVDLTGYPREEIIGRNCRFLRGTGTEDDKARILREGIFRKQPVMVEIVNYKKDGTRFRNAVMVAPIFDAEGEVEYFLGSQVEIAEDQGQANDLRRNDAATRVERLSRRQKEILILMAAGKLNKQIAYELSLSERTVKMHRSAVLKGLDVKTSADAIRVAIEAGF
ncbi:MAG: histidine kinase [Novosphingobium sp. 16-62-11]|uniref:PAS domain-containing protein n=1 Tax=Novosphingobium sp. 17-62-19 TaxID=1970406 RepID=UPI000BC510E5|nr:PAS domain-containing protein [Novosphingobium sp. 17-62-19]OYX94752.1 MAG: histidine kinase [Novosphingobium sp. 35-62-5]OYZ40005.1 MAG: histidine kinase [Novosphingobium sp. 16-62-11]OZA20683.1 MAG: histidine kinase [Novosphingobium sp. 17-62-19]HQS96637.1 PAS domain-containing protein [Novosphingobium sp.]